jgi:FAD/FMN-containing dehydrogenase
MTGVDDSDRETALRDLEERLRGPLLWPGDPGYDDARRVWNARIDREPAAIARCAGPADVVAGVEARWTDPARDAEHEAWVREFHEALRPYANGEVEMNFLTADEPDERVRAAYGDNYERLAAVKREWDPTDLFSNTQTVEPVGERSS